MNVKNGSEVAEKAFSRALMEWNRLKNKREMPWKGEKNPYRIWLSEVILQQTRVEQGLKYYNDFISAFPDIKKLANAPDEKIFKLWEGLGYYSRCRNLIATARYIANERDGIFPDTYEDIKALKGIGPYTAAAISSFAYQLPHAVVDGNVFRVLSRIFGIDKSIDSTEGKKYFTTLANCLLDQSQPGIYNQAIMDFGAIICKPQSPVCSSCIFNKTCHAFLHNRINDLPVKDKKISIKKRWFYYIVAEYKGHAIICQRTAKDIWQQLYEFPLVEEKEEQAVPQILSRAEKAGWLEKGSYELSAASALFRQQLSHQLIAGRFISVTLKNKMTLPEGWKWIRKNNLDNYAFPGFINQYLSAPKESSLF